MRERSILIENEFDFIWLCFFIVSKVENVALAKSTRFKKTNLNKLIRYNSFERLVMELLGVIVFQIIITRI